MSVTEALAIVNRLLIRIRDTEPTEPVAISALERDAIWKLAEIAAATLRAIDRLT